MLHLPDLIQDLGFILITAAVVTLIFKKLNQPVVLGYLLAGFLLSPHVAFLPSVSDIKSINIWAEIGVIFLLFGLGLEFSFKKLASVGKSATITASVEIFAMLGAGFLAGQFLGWSLMDSVFLGGILSISSTTIIVRAFDELGLKSKGFVSLVFGSLIVEDLIAILLMVLLTSVAVSQSLSGPDLLMSSFRLVFFMVLWFLLGIYLLPTLLRKLKPLLSNESTLIVSIGLCLLMVIIASKAGFSPALGAFVMGSLLAETREGHNIEKLIVPVKDLFGAVFFVSVGMLINPFVIYEYFGIIILVSAVTILGKLLSTTLGALISGSSLKNSVQAGMSMAQIGEFSFIIATLGLSLNVTSDFLYPIAVAVSAITTFTTPYLIKYSGPFSNWLDQNLPVPIKNSLQRYETAMMAGPGNNALALIWKAYGIKILFNSVIIVAITLGISRFLLPEINSIEFIEQSNISWLIGLSLALVLSGPFLWAVILGQPSHSSDFNEDSIQKLGRLQLGVSLMKLTLGGILLGFIVGQFTNTLASSGIILLTAIALGALLFSRFAAPIYEMIEYRFISNLTDSERKKLEKLSATPELAPWNAILTEFTVSQDSHYIGKSLYDSKLRDRFGITIAMIQRGENQILAPTGKELLLPFDKITIIGTDEQLTEMKDFIETKSEKSSQEKSETFGLLSLPITAESIFVGKTIRDSNIRESVHGLVVGIEHQGQRTLNPNPAITINGGDLLWIVGNLSKIKQIQKEPKPN